MPPTPKKSEKMFAWSELRNGGEGELQNIAGGRNQRYVITKRNIIKMGAEVSQSDLGVDDDTWQDLIDNGIVRPYPMPEGMDEYTSASQAFLANVSTGKGDVDVNKLMELGLSNPAAGAFEKEEEDKEVTAPSGA